jgi:hypothetical protein
MTTPTIPERGWLPFSKRPGGLLLFPTLLLGLASAAWSEREPPMYDVGRASGAIVVDGRVEEAAWSAAARFELPFEFRPAENVEAPVRTECLVTYDDRFVYVAFRAFDPEPGEIRAHVTDRDSPWRDDFVGIVLDTFDDGRRAYEFFSNPLGVQMDAIMSEVEGGGEDFGWDAIWDAAGTITPQGYEVEMAIPLAAIRFPRGAEAQSWRVFATRSYPRKVRHQISNSPVDRNVSCLLCQNGKLRGFAGLEPGRAVELDPTLTAHRAEERDPFPDGPFAESDSGVDLGLTARFGVTPNLTLGAAANPDFSQVEADALQLTVNRRFAILYEEKRPFFLEGAEYLNSSLAIVSTRAVADPDWGLRLTGKEGKGSIGAFIARDAVTNLLFPGNQISTTGDLDAPSTAAAVRYRHDLGESSTIGCIGTLRNGGDYSNGVAGLDGFLRFGESDTVRYQYVRSRAEYPLEIVTDFDQPEGAFDDDAMELLYSHDGRDWSWAALYRDLGRDFRADLGFLPRVDTRLLDASFARNYWGEEGAFVTQAGAVFEAARVEDHSGNLTDRSFAFRAWANGPYQSTASIRGARVDELYDGVLYDERTIQVDLETRPTGEFMGSLSFVAGDAVDYENSRPGRVLRVTPSVTLNLGRHLEVGIDHSYERLKVAGGELYRANLTDARFVYQFDVRTFLRAIVQYTRIDRDPALYSEPVDGNEEDLFAQLLFSYKVNPRTVVFLGYETGRRGIGPLGMTEADRAVFLKLGYAWLF